MQGQLPLSMWGLRGQGVEQFGRSSALVSDLHHHLRTYVRTIWSCLYTHLTLPTKLEV
jgi:hypothetical protein